MKDMTIFSSADKLWDVIHAWIQADQKRRQDRALVNKLFNGEPTFTDEEAIEHNIETNINFLEGTTLMHDARNQYRNAMLKPGDYFKVSVDGYMDTEKRMKASKCITSKINRIMKRTPKYAMTLRCQFASTALHGIGPAHWPGMDGWMPEGIGIDDVLIPDETPIDALDLQQFAIHREYSLHRFWSMSESKLKGWNRKATRKIIARIISRIEKGDQSDADNFDHWLNPERAAEVIKQNAGYYCSSVVPKVKVWCFYCRNPHDRDGRWVRMLIEDRLDPEGEQEHEFLFKSESPYADEHNQIAHFQFGNVANVAPFRYHSLRSLGYLLYNIVHVQNMLRCRSTDAAFADLLWWFRVRDVTDRDRIQRIDLHHLGVIPEGIDLVGREERHTPDINLLSFMLGQNRSLMSEAATSFRGDRDMGSSERRGQMSATEAQNRQSAVQSMVSAILGEAYDYSNVQFAEIARRFANPRSQDREVKEFHSEMRAYGVEKKYLDPERWVTDPVRTLGQGNKIMESVQSQLLMSIRSLLDPDKQRRVLNLFVEANTDDAGLANDLVPMEEREFPSDTIIEAQQNAAVLLAGLPVGIPQSVNRGEYTIAALQSLAVVVDRVMKRDGMPKDVEELAGMQNLSAHIAENLRIFEGDTQQADLAKQIGDELGRLDNQIRAFAQRLQARLEGEQEQGGGLSGKDIAVIERDRAMTAAKLQTRQAASLQRLEQNAARFEQQQSIDAAKAEQELAFKAQEGGLKLAQKAAEAQSQ